MDPDYPSYIRDLIYGFRESAAEARRDRLIAKAEDAKYHEGREAAYVEVLLRIQNQADAFMIPRESIGAAGFDPLCDSLDPRDT